MVAANLRQELLRDGAYVPDKFEKSSFCYLTDYLQQKYQESLAYLSQLYPIIDGGALPSQRAMKSSALFEPPQGIA